MQIKYTNYFNNTGYSISAQSYIKAMLHVNPDLDLKISAISGFREKQGISRERYEFFKKLYQKKDNPNYISIQHCIPRIYLSDKAKKRIGFTIFETIDPPDSWIKQMNTMDHIVTASHFNQGSFQSKRSIRLIRPVTVIPHCFDRELFNKEVRPDGRYGLFTFLYIGTWKERKNFKSLIKAFYQSFSQKDQVCLLLKTDKPRALKETIRSIKQDGYRTKDTASIYTEDNIIDFEGMPKLMKKADVYISPSLGEGFCTLPDSKVVTKKGYVPISSISENDKVYTHTGKFRKVIKTMNRFYSGDIIDIKILKTFCNQKLTPEHPVLAIKRNKCRKYKGLVEQRFDRDKINRKNAEWINASELEKGDFLLFPISNNTNKVKHLDLSKFITDPNLIVENDLINYKHHNGSEKPIKKIIEIDQDILWLLGIYMAEGCCNHEAIHFCFHVKEKIFYNRVKKILKDYFGLNSTLIINENKAVVRSHSVILSNIFHNLIGCTSHVKHFSNFMSFSKNQILEIFRGILDGDGQFDGNMIELQMVANILMEQLYFLLLKNGIPCGLKYSKRNHYRLNICGRPINNVQWQKAQYPIKRQSLQFHSDSNFFYIPIIKVSRFEYTGLVYNLDVDQDHTYVMQSVVHNCIPTLHAMALNIPVILTRYGGSLEYAKPDLCTYINPSGYSRRLSMDGLPQFKNCIWPEIKISEISNKMIFAHQSYKHLQEKAIQAYNYVHRHFNYDIIGRRWLSLLKDLEDGTEH